MTKQQKLVIEARIVRLKEACGVTIKKAHLAKAAKISRAAVGKWFKGGEIKADNLFAIADHCEVEARWLALGTEPKTSKLDLRTKQLLGFWSQLDDHAKEAVLGYAEGKAPLDSDGIHRPKRA